ncbi:hypothetical protein D3C75_948660 [compost metagenome]
MIFDEGDDFRINGKLLNRFIDILHSSKDTKEFQLLLMMFYFLQPYDKDFGFGSDPDLKPSEMQNEMYKDFGELLKKYDFISEF